MLRLCGKYVLCALFWGYLAVSVCIGVISLASPPFHRGHYQSASHWQQRSVGTGRIALFPACDFADWAGGVDLSIRDALCKFAVARGLSAQPRHT